jgi:hypothetical protein
MYAPFVQLWQSRKLFHVSTMVYCNCNCLQNVTFSLLFIYK